MILYDYIIIIIIIITTQNIIIIQYLVIYTKVLGQFF